MNELVDGRDWNVRGTHHPEVTLEMLAVGRSGKDLLFGENDWWHFFTFNKERST